eukprot:TRINITY_DN9248_c0_g1_i1.p2 TRINITY_DN9248_c0_g1~~TRINITY_DN9248_c0_g1_i1.p2  ORF type:complete len:114 (+),score=14.61 TRINITY_DN9248_c0_g1_i1:353-694(+)
MKFAMSVGVNDHEPYLATVILSLDGIRIPRPEHVGTTSPEDQDPHPHPDKCLPPEGFVPLMEFSASVSINEATATYATVVSDAHGLRLLHPEQGTVNLADIDIQVLRKRGCIG